MAALPPRPELTDLMQMKNRLERQSAGWLSLVGRARELRYHLDNLPTKWAQDLTITAEQRFRSNLSGNEIDRVVALMTRNRPKVYIPPAGTGTRAVQKAQKQTRWSQELLDAFERQSILPIWDRLDDAAAETGLGVVEFFLTEDYDEYADQAEALDGLSGSERRRAEEELRLLGLPFGLRTLDPTTVRWEPGFGKRSTERVLVVEKKPYRQIFGRLQQTMSTEQFLEAELPPLAALGMPEYPGWRIAHVDPTQDEIGGLSFAPDADGMVDVMRYYDDYWIVEYVAGREVLCEPHGFPGVPLFLQFGKVTSSSYQGMMLRGITFGMLEQEQTANDLLTLKVDTEFEYGRPFPVVETDVEGSPIMAGDKPAVVNLSDPHHPPQLGPGQKVADAFEGFKNSMDPGFLTMVMQLYHASGLNPIAMGETPGADASGFALNTQQSAATALYVQLLKNKQRTMGEIVDFARAVVRDTCDFPVTVAYGGTDGQPIEFVTLAPEDVDDVPARVNIDPLSDAQRLSVTTWAQAGNQLGYISRRTVQRVAYGSVIDDLDEEDNAIMLDDAKRAIRLAMTQAIVQEVLAESFPQQVAPPAPPQPGQQGGAGAQQPRDPFAPPPPPTIGRAGAQASQVTPGGSPQQQLAARGRGGQQPPSQAVPAVNG